MLLTAFLTSATVPALNSWIHREKGQGLERSRQALEEDLLEDDLPVEDLLGADPLEEATGTPSLEEPATGRERRSIRHEAPARWRAPVEARLLLWREESKAPTAFESSRLFAPEVVDLFAEKSSREGELSRALEAPDAPDLSVTREGVELRWELPENLAALRSEVSDNSLLSLGFRVYRWRRGEEPTLLATNDVSKTFYLDRGLPLWRQEFLYCVASVLEGQIGDLPTLIESQSSPVIAVETLENFSVEVLDGTPELASVRLSVFVRGQWTRQTVELRDGDAVSAHFVLEDGELGRQELELDTGLVVEQVVAVDETLDETRRRPEFLPDGRRKVNPSSGLPSFAKQWSSVPVRTVELRCRAQDSTRRTFVSSPLRLGN